MAEASLALQKAVRSRLVASAELTALVPATSIVDKHGGPTSFPSIIIGEAQVIGEESSCLAGSEVFLTLHVGTRETGLSQVKRIVGALRRALHAADPEVEGHALIDLSLRDVRFLRDPDGESGHAVVTYRAVLDEEFV